MAKPTRASIPRKVRLPEVSPEPSFQKREMRVGINWVSHLPVSENTLKIDVMISMGAPLIYLSLFGFNSELR